MDGCPNKETKHGNLPDGWRSWGIPRSECRAQHIWSKSNLCLNSIHKLDEVLLGDVAGAEVSDPVDWHDPNVLNGTKKILVERQSDVEKVETIANNLRIANLKIVYW